MMMSETIWADNLFIRATALALQVDVHICGMTATRANPWLIVHGGPTNAPPVYIGWYHRDRFANGHYQSVLPIEVPPVNVESPPVLSHEETNDVAGAESSNVPKPTREDDEDLREVFAGMNYSPCSPPSWVFEDSDDSQELDNLPPPPPRSEASQSDDEKDVDDMCSFSSQDDTMEEESTPCAADVEKELPKEACMLQRISSPHAPPRQIQEVQRHPWSSEGRRIESRGQGQGNQS